MAQQACSLTDKHCQPCEGGVPKYSLEQAQEQLGELSQDWVLAPDASALTRELKFKGFAKTMYFVNALAFLADREGHHPDVCFGWGYCKVTFSTHAIDGLSENDFICAAKVDSLIESGKPA